jgi:hypothetical protein
MPKLNPEFLETRKITDLLAQLSKKNPNHGRKAKGDSANIKADLLALQYAQGQNYVGSGPTGVLASKKSAKVSMFLPAGSTTTLPAGGQVTSSGPIAVSAGTTAIVSAGGQVVGDNMVVQTPTVVQPAGPVIMPTAQPTTIAGVQAAAGPTAVAVTGGKKKLNPAFLDSRSNKDLAAQIIRKQGLKTKTVTGNKDALKARLLAKQYDADQDYIGLKQAGGKGKTIIQKFVGSTTAPIVTVPATATASTPAPILVPTGGSMTSADIPVDLPDGGVVSFPSGGAIGTDTGVPTTTDVSSGTTVTVSAPSVVTQPSGSVPSSSSSSSSGGISTPPQQKTEAEIIAAIRACLEAPTSGGGGGGGGGGGF